MKNRKHTPTHHAVADNDHLAILHIKVHTCCGMAINHGHHILCDFYDDEPPLNEEENV